MPKTIIFDFDGTIADSFSVVVSIIHQLMHRSELVTPEEIVRLRKLHPLEVAKELGVPKWRIPFLLLLGRREMGRHIKDVPIFGGMADALTDLHKSKFQMFIVSSNSSSNVRNFLHHKNLQQCFNKKIYGGAGIADKWRVLRRLARQNKLDTKDCIYVGDEPRDITAARDAGMQCIAVTWGYNTAAILREHKPMAIVKTPEELVATLQADTI